MHFTIILLVLFFDWAYSNPIAKPKTEFETDSIEDTDNEKEISHRLDTEYNGNAKLINTSEKTSKLNQADNTLKLAEILRNLVPDVEGLEKLLTNGSGVVIAKPSLSITMFYTGNLTALPRLFNRIRKRGINLPIQVEYSSDDIVQPQGFRNPILRQRIMHYMKLAAARRHPEVHHEQFRIDETRELEKREDGKKENPKDIIKIEKSVEKVIEKTKDVDGGMESPNKSMETGNALEEKLNFSNIPGIADRLLEKLKNRTSTTNEPTTRDIVIKWRPIHRATMKEWRKTTKATTTTTTTKEATAAKTTTTTTTTTTGIPPKDYSEVDVLPEYHP